MEPLEIHAPIRNRRAPLEEQRPIPVPRKHQRREQTGRTATDDDDAATNLFRPGRGDRNFRRFCGDSHAAADGIRLSRGIRQAHVERIDEADMSPSRVHRSAPNLPVGDGLRGQPKPRRRLDRKERFGRVHRQCQITNAYRHVSPAPSKPSRGVQAAEPENPQPFPPARRRSRPRTAALS